MNEDKKNKEGIDLSGAFKDSDTGAKFQDAWQKPAKTFYSGTPKVIQWIVKYSGGLVKDEKQASYILIGFVAVAIIISLFLFLSESENRSDYNPVPVTGRESEDVNWPPPR